MTKTETMLTTVDNPYDPFEEFDNWFAFDCSQKYFTCAYIDRIVQSRNPNKLTTQVEEDEYNDCLKEIVTFNPDLYRLTHRDVDISPIDLIE